RNLAELALRDQRMTVLVRAESEFGVVEMHHVQATNIERVAEPLHDAFIVADDVVPGRVHVARIHAHSHAAPHLGVDSLDYGTQLLERCAERGAASRRRLEQEKSVAGR